jgi:hypothetical protein
MVQVAGVGIALALPVEAEADFGGDVVAAPGGEVFESGPVAGELPVEAGGDGVVGLELAVEGGVGGPWVAEKSHAAVE